MLFPVQPVPRIDQTALSSSVITCCPFCTVHPTVMPPQRHIVIPVTHCAMESYASRSCQFRAVAICKSWKTCLSHLATCSLHPETVSLQASELADLQDEANMPLEQLLAQYRYADNPQAAGPSHTSSSPRPTAPQLAARTDPLPTQTAGNTHSLTIDPTQQTGQVQAGSTDKARDIASLHRRPPSGTPGASGGPPSATPGVPVGPPSARTGVSGGAPPAGRTAEPTGIAEGVAQVKPEEQAQQATAAGMDAFEHSQALAERRASGSQAGPSALSPPAPGKSVCATCLCPDSCTLSCVFSICNGEEIWYSQACPCWLPIKIGLALWSMVPCCRLKGL